MPGIRVHHTSTSDRTWDGPANEARLRTDAEESYYRSAFAWQDPGEDTATKAAYRFIHHEVSADGEVGPANVRACTSGIAVLNGGRGGTTIPDADRQAVYNHLAAHIRDAGNEAPDLKGVNVDRKDYAIELKALSDEGVFEGTLSVYDFIDYGGDIVEPGAFSKSLKENGGKIPLLWQHKIDSPIGVGYLTDTGEALECKGILNLDAPQAKDAHSMMKFLKHHGMRLGLSIGYVSIKDTIEKGIRRLKELKLLEGSLVTLPMNRLCLVHDVKNLNGEVKDFQQNLDAVQLQAMKYQLLSAFCNTVDDILYDFDERRTREEKVSAMDQALKDFSTAFSTFIPRLLDLWGEKSAKQQFKISPSKLVGIQHREFVTAKDREALTQLFKALLGPTEGTPDTGAAAVDNGAAARSIEPPQALALLKGFSMFGESETAA